MDERDYRYYVARAECSRNLAQRAASPMVAAIHQDMARRYDSITARAWLSIAPPESNAQAA